MIAAQRKPEIDHLLDRLADARAQTDDLFGMLVPEALYERPIAERHRLVFYLGHVEAFDWNLLARYATDTKTFNPGFDRLFAFGIDPVDGGLPNDQPSDWPSIDEIHRYNERIRQELDSQLEKVSSDRHRSEASNELLLNVAIEHRLMHAETLPYMLHQLPLDRKLSPPILPVPDAPVTAHSMIDIPGGKVTLGLRRDVQGVFGWDNEFEAHQVDVSAFAIDAYPVTNHEFLRFVGDGGYDHRGLWTDSAWDWITSQQIRYPRFWVKRSDSWLYRTMFAEVPFPPEWPVYVSHAEAAAFARWAGKSLPTEAQWHRAAYGTPNGSERTYPWGEESPRENRGNFDFHRWDPTPVGAHPAGRSAFGVADLLGNGWEWTSTAFGPFPGFEPFPFYRGYSANFFDGRHYVMKGGSARTAACMLRRSFRNWFQPHYPFAYTGFRCVRN